jgi:D-sedoheptulose 7-phosphate isomerase
MTAGPLASNRDTIAVPPIDEVSWLAEAGRLDLVLQTLQETSRLHDALQEQSTAIARAAWVCWRALSQGRTVLAFGNGGSAAESQHFAAELSGRFARERKALAAVALTTDTSALTAIANDYGFHRVFGRQIEALGRPGDVAVGISTSGRSPNVLDGLATSRARGLTTIALTGPSAADLEAAADLLIAVPGPSTARVQEGQLTVLHIICDLVEREVAKV